MKGDGDGRKSILNTYLKGINTFSLLSRADEVELAKRIEKGRKAKKKLKKLIKNNPESQKKEIYEKIKEFSQKIIEGEEAKNKLAQANLRLVLQMTKKYKNRDLEMLDLIQEGNLGLFQAVEKFNWRRGYKFSTYANWWIRAAIFRAFCDQSRTIRLPIYINEDLNKLRKAWKKVIKEKNEKPTFEEIAEEMGTSLTKVENLVIVSKKTLSLDMPIFDEEEDTIDINLEDAIPDKNIVDPEKELKEEDLKKSVAKVLSTLSPREEKILRLRFGIGSEEQEHTLQEIGDKDEFQLTRERIRQIEAGAIKKLKKAGKNPLLE